MKFLILAYGAERDWKALSPSEQETLLAQDEVLRSKGSLVAAVETNATTVKSWTGSPETIKGPFASSAAPLAGFGIIEAKDLDHAVELVANTPCARARGAVEIRPILHMNAGASVVK